MLNFSIDRITFTLLRHYHTDGCGIISAPDAKYCLFLRRTWWKLLKLRQAL